MSFFLYILFPPFFSLSTTYGISKFLHEGTEIRKWCWSFHVSLKSQMLDFDPFHGGLKMLNLMGGVKIMEVRPS